MENLETSPVENVKAWSSASVTSERAFEVALDELRMVSDLVERSTTGMNPLFISLADAATRQSRRVEDIIAMVSYLRVGNEKMEMTEFVNLFDNTLSEALGKILEVSKQAMCMVFSMNKTVENLSIIESFIGRIQKVTKQTHLLALNAKIEATRVGESGKGFAVVADEVKNVSKDIDSLAEVMHREINGVVGNIRECHQILEVVATTDMSENIMAKDKLDALMKCLIEQNEEFKVVLHEASDSSREIAGHIGGVVMGMQFQDRVKQHIEDVLRGIDAITDHCAKLRGVSNLLTNGEGEKIDRELAERIVETFLLSDVKQRFVAALLAHHDIENASELRHKSDNESSGSQGGGGDNVELF